MLDLRLADMSDASLSARRAWIEILTSIIIKQGKTVALRKESVDRNSIEPANLTVSITSLSARRAWIEIGARPNGQQNAVVALRKESVDRNVMYH